LCFQWGKTLHYFEGFDTKQKCSYFQATNVVQIYAILLFNFKDNDMICFKEFFSEFLLEKKLWKSKFKTMFVGVNMIYLSNTYM
jgi:hypothetical protein